jgi:MoaA/NifB/PqqE/SkfB family radical SAM enzyme
MEWKDPFTPFNSFKVCVWREQFEALARGEIPKPVSVSLDSTNLCNLSCQMCQYQEYRREFPNTVSEEDLLLAVDNIKKLGAKSICYAGGGEGTLHPSTGKVLRYIKDNGLEAGMITNGIKIDQFMEDILYSLLWVGVSIDAATPETYQKIKGGTVADFYKVINNIRQIILHRKNGDPTVGYKFLITPDNYHEIIPAAQLAKSLGVNFLHLRPAYTSKKQYRPMWYPQEIKEVLGMAEHVIAMSTEEFLVQCVTHKNEQDFSKKTLKKCEITPIAGLTFAADGQCYICCDTRGEEQGRLCRWNEILDIWGSEQHRKILEALDPKKCVYRCTYSPYQNILENMFKKDKTRYFFP